MLCPIFFGNERKNKFLAEKQGDERSQEKEKTTGREEEDGPKKKIFKPDRPPSRSQKSSSGGELPDLPDQEGEPQPSTSGYTKNKTTSQERINRYQK